MIVSPKYPSVWTWNVGMVSQTSTMPHLGLWDCIKNGFLNVSTTETSPYRFAQLRINRFIEHSLQQCMCMSSCEQKGGACLYGAILDCITPDIMIRHILHPPQRSQCPTVMMPLSCRMCARLCLMAVVNPDTVCSEWLDLGWVGVYCVHTSVLSTASYKYR